jgi:NADPH-dependent 2,4-dienoyl-CoA reductase/sulfur reductase-like enzyme
MLLGATVIDAPTAGRLVTEQDGRLLQVDFDRLVLATGARERFLPFPGWTLPGILGVGGLQALLKSGGRLAGLRTVFAGSGPLLLAAAATCAAEGAQIVGVLEQAPVSRVARFGLWLCRRPARLAEAVALRLRLWGVGYRPGAWIRSAHGHDSVESVLATDGRREWRMDCDVLACGYGLVPNLELPRLLGCATAGGALSVDEEQRTSLSGVYAAGDVGGIAGADQALVTGAIAGSAAAGRRVPAALRQRRARGQAFAAALSASFELRPELRRLAGGNTVVCRCEDVPFAALEACSSAREGKLATRAGMGPCQGRVCGPALEFLFGWEAGTVRPPLEPTLISLLEENA